MSEVATVTEPSSKKEKEDNEKEEGKEEGQEERKEEEEEEEDEEKEEEEDKEENENEEEEEEEEGEEEDEENKEEGEEDDDDEEKEEEEEEEEEEAEEEDEDEEEDDDEEEDEDEDEEEEEQDESEGEEKKKKKNGKKNNRDQDFSIKAIGKELKDAVKDRINIKSACKKVAKCSIKWLKTGGLGLLGNATLKAFCVTGMFLKRVAELRIEYYSTEIASVKSLVASMDKIAATVKNNSNKLRSIITEHDFYTEIVVPVDVLMHLQRNMYQYHDLTSVETYKKQYAEVDPLRTALKMLKFIEHDVLNPLTNAANDEPLQSKEIIEVWRTFIIHQVDHLYIVFHTHEGLMYDREVTLDDHSPEVDAFRNLRDNMEKSIENFEVDYWQSVMDLMKNTANDEDMDNAEKAECIRDQLLNIHAPGTEFVVIVYDKCGGLRDQVLKSNGNLDWYFGNTSILVYRTQYLEMRSEEEIDEFKDAIEDRRDDEIFDDKEMGMKEGIEKRFDEVPLLGLVGVIKKKLNVEVRSTTEDLAWITETRSLHDPSKPQGLISSIFGRNDENDVREDVVFIWVPHDEEEEREDECYTIIPEE